MASTKARRVVDSSMFRTVGLRYPRRAAALSWSWSGADDADPDERADGAPAPTAKARVWPCRPRRGSAADERSQTGEDQLRLVHQDEPLSHGQRGTAAELLGVGGGAKVREAGRRERKHEQDVQERPLQVRVVAGKGSSSGGGEAHRREPEAPASREDNRHQRHPATVA